MNKGFTLIELAIIAVVVGLLLAGVVVGKSLVEAATVNKIISDFAMYEQASYKFKDKYKFWPGDFPFASSHWDVSPGTGDQQGNGDGDINDSIATTPVSHERIAYWQHLALSGYIDGIYSGQGTDSAGGLNGGDNVPLGAKDNTMITVNPTQSFGGEFFHLSFDDNLWAGFYPKTAFAVDSKVDDALANNGKVRGPSDSSCSTDGSATSGYDLDDSFGTTERCVIQYLIDPAYYNVLF